MALGWIGSTTAFGAVVKKPYQRIHRPSTRGPVQTEQR
jgi:hypothetical protein